MFIHSLRRSLCLRRRKFGGGGEVTVENNSTGLFLFASFACCAQMHFLGIMCGILDPRSFSCCLRTGGRRNEGRGKEKGKDSLVVVFLRTTTTTKPLLLLLRPVTAALAGGGGGGKKGWGSDEGRGRSCCCLRGGCCCC